MAQESGEITVEMIASAEKVAGVSFTDAERRSMVKTLNSFRKQYEAFRAYNLPNSAPPALVFNPVPPGMKFSGKESPSGCRKPLFLSRPEWRISPTTR
jgi:hypothetical protein